MSLKAGLAPGTGGGLGSSSTLQRWEQSGRTLIMSQDLDTLPKQKGHGLDGVRGRKEAITIQESCPHPQLA